MINAERKFINNIIQDNPTFIGSEMEHMHPKNSVKILSSCPRKSLSKLWNSLSLSYRDIILPLLPDRCVTVLLEDMDSYKVAQLIRGLSDVESHRYMQHISVSKRLEVEYVLDYPASSVGSIMDVRPISVNINSTVANAIAIFKKHSVDHISLIYLVDEVGELQGYITPIQLVIASKSTKLSELYKNVEMKLQPFDQIEEVSKLCETNDVLTLPIVDVNNRLVGVVRSKKIFKVIQDEALIDMQTMVGASKEERSLSTPLYAVRKRQLWLQINLLTAFLASAVVGLFESTIAQVTALAVLLPIAAGQSGNAGAQAMAICMRGLSIKEITSANWIRIAIKEWIAGVINGTVVAIVCMAGVYVWSRDFMLSVVLAVSLVISMTVAGVAGALVPILLKKCGQDPAQSSSIILTTITDVVGFFSFLGIATLLLLNVK